jgi:outer membrane protein assembly factor BamD (BamD/ComL family)
MRLYRLSVLILFLSGSLSVLGSEMSDAPTPTPKGTPSETKKPVKRGVHWYRHPAQTNAAAQEAYAFSLYENGQLRASANAYQALVYAWPDSRQAVSAQLALAKIQQKREKYEKAFDEYQYLIDHYAGQFNYPEVLDLQFQIANYLMNSKRGQFLFFPGFESPERAVPLFESIIRNAPSWEKTPLAQFNLGMIHESNSETEEAIAAYEVLLNRYPGSQWAPDAAYHQACCLEKLSADRPNDENAINDAISALIDFIQTYPNSSGVPDASSRKEGLIKRLEHMAFERARFYDKLTRRPEAALQSYEDFLKRFPSSESANLARERIAALKLLVKGSQTP